VKLASLLFALGLDAKSINVFAAVTVDFGVLRAEAFSHQEIASNYCQSNYHKVFYQSQWLPSSRHHRSSFPKMRFVEAFLVPMVRNIWAMTRGIVKQDCVG
jgi:hypothetical protein